MRERDVAFHMRRMAVHHDVDNVVAFDGDGAIREGEFRQRNDAFGLVAEVNDHFFIGDL